MSIVLVRHGETDGNKNRILQVPETPLNATGLRQAQRLATRLSALGVARIVTSDLLRARMTAEAISKLSGIPLTLSPTLRERDFGDLRGTAYAELAENPFRPGFVPPNGESWDVFHARVAEAFALILTEARATAGNLVVVTHGFVCRAILERHVPPLSGSSLPEQLANTGVTSFEHEPPHRLTLLNCGAHLTLEEALEPSGGAA